MNAVTLSEHARRWGALWGDRPDAWAVSEEQQTPVYEDALRHAGLVPGDRVLDLGCGTGVFLRMCADRGADVTGLDAAEGLLAIARERVPEADLRLGDLQALPYPDDSFDLVTGFTSFFFAEDIVAALREAGRVARPGAPVAMQVFGRPERCDIETLKVAVKRFRPAGSKRYWRQGVAAELATQAGLAVERTLISTWPYEYVDADALVEAMLAAGGLAAIAGPAREAEVCAAILRALAHCRRADGSYRVSNEWQLVIARA
jgi:ubiquinone/menaquinone biosynthesis C-methylase UbiE